MYASVNEINDVDKLGMWPGHVFYQQDKNKEQKNKLREIKTQKQNLEVQGRIRAK